MLPNWLYGKSKSKLAELLGGGGTPSDYTEVKAQVTQNAEDIALLNNTVEGKVDWGDYSELGAVNSINFTAITPTSPINGVTFTVNSDKSITCSNATATDSIRFVVGTSTLKAGKSYRINDLKNGTPNAAEDGPFGVAVRVPSGTWLMNTASTPGAQPTIYTPTIDTKVEIIVYINSGFNANRTFYPMLTCATYTGPYAPPAKTNKELTDLHSIHSNSYTIHQDWDASTVQDPLAKRLGITASMTLEQMIKQFQGGDDNNWGLNIKISTNYASINANSVQWIKDIYNIFNTNGIALIDITLCTTVNGRAFISFTTSAFNSLKFVMLNNWTADTVKSISFDT